MNLFKLFESRRNRESRGFLYSFVSVFFVAPVFIVASIVMKSMPAETASTMFFGAGFLITSVISTLRKRNREVLPMVRKYFRPLLLLGIFNTSAAILFFTGIKSIGPSSAAFISRFETIFVILLGVLLLKEKLGKMDMLGMAITVSGVIMVTYSNVSMVIGSFFIFASSALISFQRILLKKYVSKIQPMDLNQLRLFFSFVLLLSYVVLSSRLVMPSAGNLLLIGIVSLSAPVIGFYLRLKAMELIDVSKVMTVESLEPFIVVLMSIFLLGSITSPRQILGGGVMIVGITMLLMSHRMKGKEKSMPVN
ncbi:MAG: DMT family transporter [Candidatus Aenigmarchaeota archaeon]|nr:DMT family transporter [Candidatus Aenigmarchaeota archaeon]